MPEETVRSIGMPTDILTLHTSGGWVPNAIVVTNERGQRMMVAGVGHTYRQARANALAWWNQRGCDWMIP